MSELTYATIDQTVLQTLEKPRPGYWAAVAVLAGGMR